MNFPSEKDDWKKYDKNNLTIALSVLYAKKENIFPACVSKHKSNREKQVIPLMIPNGEGWHCLSIIKLFQLLKRITSKHHGDFYCFNCLHFFRTKNKKRIFVTQLCLLKTLTYTV